MLLKSKINTPIHYGTFSLSFENYEDPILDLKNAMKMYDVKPTHFSILQNGQYIDINKILNSS